MCTFCVLLDDLMACRDGLQDQSSDEYEEGDRAKRQRKDWRTVKQLPNRADPATAAKNKASRERQRRERLNDR